MIFVFFSLCLIYISIIGYSKLYKFIFIKNDNNTFENLDIFYGFLVLICISTLINFFLPLKYFSIILIIGGILILIYFLYKKKIILNHSLSFIFILFFLIFLSSHQSPNIDSEVYHLQILNKAFTQKVIFGIANIEEKYGMVSLWQIFLALFNHEILDFKIVYFVNLILFSVFFNEAYIQLHEKNKLSKIFLILAASFILIFSLIHPFNNGIILNHLGSVEVDLLGGFLFILCIYLGLRLLENYSFSEFNILFILTAIVILSKPSYIVLSIFPLIITFIIKKNFLNITNILLLVLFFLFLSRGLITSGCLIFPSPITCIDTFWALDFESVQRYENIILGFARDKMRYSDFDYVIYSYDWVIPWFKNYFLKTSLLQIFILLVCASLIILILGKFKNIKFLNLNLYVIFYFLFGCFLFWLRAPEVRFGFGTIISLSIFIPSVFIYLQFKNFEFNDKYFKIILIIPFFLILKNIENYKYFFENYSPKYNYKYKVFLPKEMNVVQIASPTDRCVDIDEVCMYYPSKIKLSKLNSYKFYHRPK